MTSRGLAAVALAVFCTAARGADVAVFPAQAVNLTPGQAEAVGTVLAQAYAQVSGSDVIPPRAAAAAVTDPAHLTGAAAQLGVREYIEVTAIGLLGEVDGSSGDPSSRIIIQAARRSSSGEVIYRAELSAVSMGDLEIVAQRLARALFEKKPATDTLDLHTVTRKESLRENRTFSEKVIGFKFGMIWPMAKNARYDPMIAGAFDTRLEVGKCFLEIGAGIALPKSTDNDKSSQGIALLFAEIGGSYYLIDGNVSPYVGIGLSPRIVVSELGGVNLAGYGQLGFMFLRQSTTRIYADVRATQNFLPIEQYVDYSNTGKKFYPVELGVQLGVGW